MKKAIVIGSGLARLITAWKFFENDYKASVKESEKLSDELVKIVKIGN